MKKIFLSFILVALFVSCQNNAEKVLSGYEKAENGLYYKFYSQNEGDKPQTYNYVDVIVTCSINDTFEIIPKDRNIIKLTEPMFKGDIYDAFAMMSKGDSASFITRTDSTLYTLFGLPTLPSNIKADDITRFEVKLNDFYPESELMLKQIGYIKEAYPQETVDAENELVQYLKDNKVDVEPTMSGLYYQKIKEGDGEMPSVGSFVKVHYTGRLLDGTVFDSSVEAAEPIRFKLGAGEVIRGWDEGIQLMSKGEKGVLYIPFYLAYVDRQAGIIPPFSTLVFEVELVDF